MESPTSSQQQQQFGCIRVSKIAGVKESSEHVYALAFSHDGKYLAVTFGNGTLRVFDAETWSPLARGRLGVGFDDIPSTSVKWRPEHPESDPGIYELASVSTGGALFLWNFDVTDPESIFLDRVWKCVEDGNETAACDFSPNGMVLATGGSDRIIRTYDPTNRKLTAKLDKGLDETGHSRPAHTNRIFSVRFASNTILLSGGWEAPVQVWDLRTGMSERQLSGPQISSDGIEVTPGSQTVLTVSKRDTKQIQLFDYLSGRENLAESEKLSANAGRAPLSQIRFSPEARIIWTATTKPDVLLCIDASTGALKGSVESGALGSILCIERCPTVPKRCVVGSMKESIFVVDCD